MIVVSATVAFSCQSIQMVWIRRGVILIFAMFLNVGIEFPNSFFKTWVLKKRAI